MPRSLAVRRSPRPSSFVAALAVALVAAACGKDATAPVDPAFLGSWTLVAVGDSALPATSLSGSQSRTEIRSGTLTLSADRTFLRTETDRFYDGKGAVVGSDTPRNDDGIFRVNGATLVFLEDFGPGLGFVEVGHATVSGTTLTFSDDFAVSGKPYVYRKP